MTPLTEHIAAGRFKASVQSQKIFQAHLGTCLGVALVHKNQRAGGLIHVLLPEPPGSSPPEFPEKYASTGIPMLIKAMGDLGCRPNDLTAVIAGGALMGPVTYQDMGLDIGGRSLDVAQSILKTHGIKIIKSETGGFFICTLELDLTCGRTRITPATELLPRISLPFSPPTKDDILTAIDHLKPIPQTALKMLRMFRDDRHNIEDIIQVLSQDQVLSAQTLKLCNTALFSGTLQVDTIKDAVLLLGEDALVKGVLTAAVKAYYTQTGTSGYSLCRGGLFFHAVGTAHIAESLALKTQRVPPNQAYTAGLLHDIGKVVLDQSVARSAPLLFRHLDDKKDCLATAESKILGTNHCKTGQVLAKKWQFSSALTQVIRYHHHPEEVDTYGDLVAIVYLADLLMGKFVTGFDLERPDTESLYPVLSRLGLTADDLIGIMDTFPLTALART